MSDPIRIIMSLVDEYKTDIPESVYLEICDNLKHSFEFCRRCTPPTIENPLLNQELLSEFRRQESAFKSPSFFRVQRIIQYL